MKGKIRNIGKYGFEFLSIFIAVISAFALNNWNDNKRDHRAESGILSGILRGLEKDREDIQMNVAGHEAGLRAGEFWLKVFTQQEVDVDSVQRYYFLLTRDFVSIQNTSGYQTLKSRGLELIKNDSLRTKIISLYEYDYQTLMKLEEQYNELQFQENYFQEINNTIAPYFEFDAQGNIRGMKLPLSISPAERNILLTYLWKMKVNRKFILGIYGGVQGKLEALSEDISQELNK